MSQHLIFDVYGGYGGSAFNDDLGSPFVEIGMVDLWSDSSGNTTVNPLYGSLGGGFKTGLSMGLFTNKHFGFVIETWFTKTPEILLAEMNTATYKATHHVQSERLMVAPLIIFSTQMPKWNIYGRSGFTFPITGKTVSTVEIDDDEGRLARDRFGIAVNGATTDVTITAETTGKFSYGFKASLGVDYHLHNNIHLFCEANLAALTIKTKETVLTEYDMQTYVNGTIILEETTPDLEEWERYTIYQPELTHQSNNEIYNTTTFNPDLPNEELAFKQNYSSVGFQAGIRFVMGVGKNKKSSE